MLLKNYAELSFCQNTGQDSVYGVQSSLAYFVTSYLHHSEAKFSNPRNCCWNTDPRRHHLGRNSGCHLSHITRQFKSSPIVN